MSLSGEIAAVQPLGLEDFGLGGGSQGFVECGEWTGMSGGQLVVDGEHQNINQTV